MKIVRKIREWERSLDSDIVFEGKNFFVFFI